MGNNTKRHQHRNHRFSRVILISGCSSGFGLAAAVHLARLGHIIYATMRNPDKQEPLQSAINDLENRVHVHRLDVTVTHEIESVINTIEHEQGRLDVLINNAGYGLGGFFEDTSESEFRSLMETNFFGVLNVTRTSLPLLRKTENATIINISSMAGLTSTPAMSAYNSSKWALEGFSESLRLELKLLGIRVVLIEPGAYPTRILSENTRMATAAEDFRSPYFKFSRVMIKRFREHNQTLRSDPQEVVDLIDRIIHDKDPRFRNIIGPRARLRYILRKYFPWKLYEWLIIRVIFGRKHVRESYLFKESDGMNP